MSQVRVLYAACDRVPGPTAAGMRLGQLILTFCQQLEADGLSIKSEDLAHIQRLGTARMMRVPAPDTGFVERISAFQRALKRQVEGDSYDLVHAADAWAGAVAAQHKDAAADLKVITEMFELPSQTLEERYPGIQLEDRLRNIIRRGETLVLQRSDVIVVPSAAAQVAVVAAGAQAERIRVLPPAVDESVFFSGSVEVRLHDGGFNVLYAGVPDPRRGLTVFLDAVARLPADTVATLLRGPTKEMDALAEAAISARGLGKRILWHDGSTPQKLAQAFHGVDAVVVLPHAPPHTIHAGHVPRRILEAMACKRAVVASDTPGVRSVLEDGGNGMVVERKPEALHAALQRLASENPFRNRMAQRAADTAMKHTWAVRVGTYRQLYEQLLPGQRFQVEEARGGRTGGLADKLRAQKAAAPRTVVRDEVANRPAAPRPANAAAPTPTAPRASSPAVAAVPVAAAAARPAAAPVAAKPPAFPTPPPPEPTLRLPEEPVPKVEFPPAPNLPASSRFDAVIATGSPTAPMTVVPPPNAASFLTEPTPAGDMPSEPTPAQPFTMPTPDIGHDPWQGDTVAVTDVPMHGEDAAADAPDAEEAADTPADEPPPPALDEDYFSRRPGRAAMPMSVPVDLENSLILEDAASVRTESIVSPLDERLPASRPVAPAPSPSGSMRGPVGMRSLALLDELQPDGSGSAPPRPNGVSEETERVDLSAGAQAFARQVEARTNAKPADKPAAADGAKAPRQGVRADEPTPSR